MKKAWMGLLAAALVGAVAARGEWYDDAKIKADVRYRFENVKEDGKDTVNRDRIRARVGLFPRLGSELDMGLQLTTGEESKKINPTSGNANLTDVFGKKSIYLDLAYLDYHPAWFKGFNVVAGKIKNPFICVGDYIWDNDVTPEGLAAKYHVGETVELLANGGYFWLLERSAGADSKLIGGQLAAKANFSEDTALTAGCSLYSLSEIEGMDVVDYNWKGESKAYGNSTTPQVKGNTTNNLYNTGFQELEPFVQFGTVIGLPFNVFGSYVVNQDADALKKGFMVGCKFGEAKDPNTFEVAYDYRKLEKDATFGALADSDSFGGGTDGKGHKFAVRYQVLKNWQVAATYFLDKKEMSKTEKDYKRLQLDLSAKF